VLIDIAAKIRPDVQVFSLDTGRLHPETYRFIERVRDHYDIRIDLLMPDAQDVQDLVSRKGLFSFYRDGHQECCSIRKIKPLRRHLAALDAWITGQRRDQSITRTDVPLEQDDAAFSTIDHRVVKFNPLASWTSADVWAYIRANDSTVQPAARRRFHEYRLRALHAPGRAPMSTNATVAGGGKKRQAKNAVCTHRTSVR
jgi:phosphoadenosine phosphosulfate reductase